ncbi:branched-chain amino acid ABC transporter permease [Roseibaca sp. V10]|uniref:Branched-chain amino acid ABC transporter permease n=1 Tax=Roseinatronobacter domitianus TaxID=2940293 RepID=A0ABT0LY06_9RHOB|nr:branched-chain amino acid ABC transporter permease [Roseibaca domitiana]MCL1627500.1 branched-chain amino acid ABC transporter permease [Roseibaca domitiana]
MARIPHIAGLLLIAFFLAFPLVYTGANYDYVMHVLITGFFYAILASSWSMLAGYAGQFSFGHMAFMGIGAYGTALFCHYFYITEAPTGICTEFGFFGNWLVIKNAIGVTSTTLTQDCLQQAIDGWGDTVRVWRMPVLLGIILGTLAGGLAGLLVGLLVLRLRAAYLALFTLGFSEIIKAIISAEIDITRGQAGLVLPPLYGEGLNLFGLQFGQTDKIPPYYTMFALLLACLAILTWLSRSRFGLFVRALREDADAAAALGVNTTRYKVIVFTITTAMAAAAGAVQAHYVQIVTPNMLFLLQMSLVVAMAVIGGVENFVAAALGAIFLQIMLELLRTSFSIGGIEVDMTVWRLVFFGVLLMLVLRFARNGLLAPLIDRFARIGVAEETIAKRKARQEAQS